jgi:hypothetical protein
VIDMCSGVSLDELKRVSGTSRMFGRAG